MKYLLEILYYLLVVAICFSIGCYVSDCKTSKDITTTESELNTQPSYEFTAEFSAYTLSESETDKDFCIGSRNLNLCKLKPILEDRGLKICASRDLPLDTVISIEGIGECIILDRMNFRYLGTGNIDILMDNKEEANNFGRKPLRYNMFIK